MGPGVAEEGGDAGDGGFGFLGAGEGFAEAFEVMRSGKSGKVILNWTQD